MPRPHLLMVTPQFGRFGGVGVSAERIAHSLRRDLDLIVIVPDKEVTPGTYQEERSPGLVLIHCNGGGEKKFALQFLVDIVLHLAEEQRLDAVGGFYVNELAYAASIAASRLELPLFLFARGNDIDLEIFGESAFFITQALSRAKKIFCVTRELAEKVNAFTPHAKTVYVPNGVDEALFPLQEAYTQNKKITLGLFGDLKQKKGLDFALAALDFNRFDLRIVGALRPECAKLLQAHFALHPRTIESIKHIPFTKNLKSLLEEYHSVDIVCIPSVHEGMPNVLLEAMSCGKVVLASAVGGALDVIRHGENGYLFAPRDLASFKSSLEEAVQALHDAGDLRRCARMTIEQDYSWSSERERYLEALELSAP